MLCLCDFELYSRWVPLTFLSPVQLSQLHWSVIDFESQKIVVASHLYCQVLINCTEFKRYINAGNVTEYRVTAWVGYSVSLSVQQAFRRIPPDPSKVIRCKSSMKYGIPNCLSHILNPIETVPTMRDKSVVTLP